MAMQQTMDIVDMAIPPIVCQKSDFHRSSDFQSSQMLDSLQIPAKIISGQNMLAFQRYFDARNLLMVHFKSRMLFGLFDSTHTF
jgi:hypothetical protein